MASQYCKPVGFVALLTTSLLFVLTIQAQAQPVLHFKRILNNYPTIELYFSGSCAGEPIDLHNDRRHLRVFENGWEVNDFHLWCPPLMGRCAISVGLVFDAGGSMYGIGNPEAKAAGLAFVDMMDGIVDEAAVLWFNQSVTVKQSITVYKDMLRNAIDSLPAEGNSAVWDGIYHGIQELIANGLYQCRAVIVFTNGRDDASSRTPEEIVALASRNGIRIFVIGVEPDLQSSILEAIANMTNGRYYQNPSAAQLSAVYAEISTYIFQGFQECLITYESRCADGGLRTVDLSLIDVCNGSDTRTKTYRMHKDSTTFPPLTIRMGQATVRGNERIAVPLELVTPVANDIFHPATFTLLFDENCVRFRGLTTPSGSLLEGVPVTIAPVAGGLTIRTAQGKTIDGNGVLAELEFEASDPPGKDTISCVLQLQDWIFEAGCFLPVLIDGTIRIIPRCPRMYCTIGMPRVLVWETSNGEYSPNPFVVRMDVSNAGDRESTNTRFRIICNKNDFALVSPLSDVQYGNPLSVEPNGISEARWEVLAKHRGKGDTLLISFDVEFDNHRTISGWSKVWIPRADDVTSCTELNPELEIQPSTPWYSRTSTHEYPTPRLLQNHPNPFTPSTTIPYVLGQATRVTLVVYDALGREVRRLIEEQHAAGPHAVEFIAGDLPSGIYLYRLEAGGRQTTRTMVLLK